MLPLLSSKADVFVLVDSLVVTCHLFFVDDLELEIKGIVREETTRIWHQSYTNDLGEHGRLRFYLGV